MERIFWIKTADGRETKMVSRATLERLRMLMDWQVEHQEGYDPASVNEACRKADGE